MKGMHFSTKNAHLLNLLWMTMRHPLAYLTMLILIQNLLTYIKYLSLFKLGIIVEFVAVYNTSSNTIVCLLILVIKTKNSNNDEGLNHKGKMFMAKASSGQQKTV